MIGLPPISWQSAVAAGLYLVSWSLLDLVGFVFEISPGVSPWYPPHGLSLAFLLICGVRYWPLLIIGPLINGSLIWLKGEWLALILLALCITSGYGLAAWLLQRWRFQTRFNTLRDTLLFLGVGIVSSFFVAFTSITAFAVTGVVPWDRFAISLINFWAGDTLGVIGLGPIFLLAMRPFAEWLQVSSLPILEPREAVSPRPSWPIHVTQIASTTTAVAVSPFTWNAFSYPPLYFLFGPLMWIAITRGVEGSIWCITGSNVGLALLIGFTPAEVSVADLQLFMVAFSASGLVLGSTMPVIRQSALLRESNTLLNQRNDELHQLTYSLSHDLQAPLRGIHNLAQWIAEDAGDLLPGSTQQDLVLLQQSASRMQGMIDEIRNYARITREQTAPEWVQTGALVKETIDLPGHPEWLYGRGRRQYADATGPESAPLLGLAQLGWQCG